LPLPLQVSSLSGKGSEVPSAGGSEQNGSKGFNVNNPFVSDTFQHQESGPASLDNRQEPSSLSHRRILSDSQTFQSLPHNKDNPFMTNNDQVKGKEGDVSKRVGSWNPFEDTVSFGAVTEDFIFGAEFDKMRTVPTPENVNIGPSSGNTSRRDPFGSAPFSVQEKQC